MTSGLSKPLREFWITVTCAHYILEKSKEGQVGGESFAVCLVYEFCSYPNLVKHLLCNRFLVTSRNMTIFLWKRGKEWLGK